MRIHIRYIADPDPDPGSASAFRRIRIRGVKHRPERKHKKTFKWKILDFVLQ